MLVRKLEFEGFRNLHSGQWIPSEGVNILYGDNAQGKTNLLEACWLFTGARSFRGAKEREMIGFDATRATLLMDFLAEEREQQACISIEQRRTATLNGVKLSSAARLAGHFCGMVFSPTHLSLLKDGPEGRRQLPQGRPANEEGSQQEAQPKGTAVYGKTVDVIEQIQAKARCTQQQNSH